MSLLERVLEINTCFPVKESEKFSVTTAADKLLQEYRDEPDPSHELTYAVIRLYRYLKQYKAAFALMVNRRPVIKEKAREIDFYETELHFLCGERSHAEQLLAKLEAGGKLRPSWKRSLDKIRARFDSEGVWDELAELEQGIARLQFNANLEEHLEILKGVLPAPNDAMEVLLFVRDRIDALNAIAPGTAQADPALFDKYHVGHLIFTCGFSWSGSGAVSCFLSQHKAVTQPFGMSELGYIQGRSGRKGIFPFIEGDAVSFDTMKQLLATFCIESIVCLRAIKHHYSILMQCCRADQGRVLVLGELVDDFNRMMLAADALASVDVRRGIVARFLQRLFSVRGGSNILLNNVFMAPRTELLGLMEDAVFVAVQRDARDQFIARKTESRDAGHQNVEEFAAMLLRGRGKYERIRASVPPAAREKRLVELRFEDFILQEAARKQLLDRLGLPHEGLVPDVEKFDPSVSVRNVGIHQEQLTDDERSHIETSVGIYHS